jgi:2-polyprenyl-3-methyl-5-hydroxy-6-metoxy-1,4-benzoquinol methylase
MIMEYNLVKNKKYGFLQIDPTPKKKELKEFYEKKYFQEGKGGYTASYTKDELDFFTTEVKVIENIYERLSKKQSGKVLDLGCGEGFQSMYFRKKGYDISCFDFSDHGVKTHNPALLSYLRNGDIDVFLKEQIEGKETYSVILLKGVLEHLSDPEVTLSLIKQLMKKDTLFFISVPNDYSAFQKYLVENDYTKNTWFCPPEHLNYFQFESLLKFSNELGFEVVSLQAGFGVEQFLLNEFSNYVKNKKTGKQAHFTRCKVTSFLANESMNKFIKLREAYADLSYGRDIQVFLRLK